MEKYLSMFLETEFLIRFVSSVVAFFIIFILYKIFQKYVIKKIHLKVKLETSQLINKIIKYVFIVFTILYFLDLFGINISGILGAAGIAGVAIGFASQTAISNIISGFFVLSEKALKVGDYITIGDISGTVNSINLLSVRIFTTDNQMVRIPNQSIINTNLINNTYFPERRLTLKITVGYDTDLDKAISVLKSVSEKCPSALKTPEPVVFCDGFTSEGIVIVLGTWFKNENIISIKNEIHVEIKKAFEENNLISPFNRIQVSLVDASSSSEEGEH